MRYKLVFSYDGSNYYGYAIQKNESKTIQATIEKALSIIFSKSIKISASGRTDKGVHDGPTLDRIYKRANGKKYDPFDPKRFWQIPHLLKLKKQMKRLAELLKTKYVGYDVNGHRGVSEGKYDGYSPANVDRVHGLWKFTYSFKFILSWQRIFNF